MDLDLSLVQADMPNLELRRGDIMAGPVAPGDFDLVTARAVLHHVADARIAVENLVASARPGAAILLIEPDFLPVSVAEPPEIRAFWDGWLAWSRQQGIDYFIGRRLPRRLPSWDSTKSLRRLRQRCTTAALSGRATGSSRSSSCATASSGRARSTTS